MVTTQVSDCYHLRLNATGIEARWQCFASVSWDPEVIVAGIVIPSRFLSWTRQMPYKSSPSGASRLLPPGRNNLGSTRRSD